MWTISKVLAMAVLTGLSVMDYRIRKVPRDVLLLCMAGVIIYQVLTGNVDWKLSVAGGLSGILFLWISKITNETIGYGDSLAILILDISGNLGTFGSAYDGIFHPWNYRIDLCGNKKKKERTCFSFLSISDSGISAWGVYRRNLRWRKESKGG